MAITLGAARTFFNNTANLDHRAIDAVTLADGRVLFAFGGSSSVDAVIYSGIVDPAAGLLGPLTTQVLPRLASGGLPVSTLRRIELGATSGDGAVVTMHLVSTSIGDDANFALATQRLDGTTFLATARPVNPGLAGQDTHEDFDTVVLGNGGFVTFHSSPGTTGGFVNLSDGIWMTRFNANGTIAQGPVQVIDEVVLSSFPFLENNPERPEAVLMKNNNIGIVYTEKTPSGSAVSVFQVLTPQGVKVGDAVPLGAGLTPRLIVLDGGRMLAVADRAQFLTPQGEKSGAPFDLLPPGRGKGILDLVALGNGGFAVAFGDGITGLAYGQMFNAKGKPLTNSFLLLDTIADFGLRGPVGLLPVGDDLFAWVSGIKATPGMPDVFDGQMFDGSGSMGLIEKGTSSANTITGAGLDDILRGQGGKDTLAGQGGNDLLFGGNGIDRLDGGGGEDELFGDASGDRLFGGGGVDNLYDDIGNDSLFGGAGRDRLAGGLGADVLAGGSGADLFVFATPGEGGDRITDFNAAEGDRIVLHLARFQPGVLTVGEALDPTRLGLFFETATGRLTFDPDGAGATQRQLVAILEGVPTLTTNELQFAYW